MVELILIASATALATGVGALPVAFLDHRIAAVQPALWGFAAGVMAVASVVGLVMPALDEGSTSEVVWGLAGGVAFLLAARLALRGRDVHVGELSGGSVRTSVLVFSVLLVHSLPEGFAIGTAYASDTAELGLFVILAIGLQNVPEGTSVAIPMQQAGFSAWRQFWAAVLTSAPQPIGAVIAYVAVETISGLLPVSFAFAAGAMSALVVTDLAPPALRGGATGIAGIVAGASLMLGFSAVLGI